MKKMNLISILHKSMYVMLTACITFTMPSCTTEEDDNGITNKSKLEVPAYDAIAAKYEITDASSQFKSIELTASGNFIIRLNTSISDSTGSYSVSPVVKPRMLVSKNHAFSIAKPTVNSRSYTVWSDILYGTYTQIEENKYALDGYGILTVATETGNAYNLYIEKTTGETYNIEANKAGKPQEGNMTNALCRTWDITGYHYFMRVNGKNIMSIKASSLSELEEKLKEWAIENDPDYSDGDYDLGLLPSIAPQQVVFCKSGTYMVLYSNEMLAVSTWRWENQSTGLLLYSWNPDSFDDSNISGQAKIQFNKNQLQITEGFSESEDGYSYEMGLTTILNEVILSQN